MRSVFKSVSKRQFTKLSSADVVKQCKEHNIFSWSVQSKINPIAIEKADGCFFWDFDGKKYFDLNSQLMCSNIGHNNIVVRDQIKKQVDELSFAGPAFATKIRADAAKALAKHTPGDLKKFFYTLGGAEANENAIKFAKFFTKRNKFVARFRSYHGATQGAICLTGDPRRWPNEPSLPGIIRTFDPYKYRSQFYKEGMSDEEFSSILVNLLEEQLIYENPESFAGIFIETVTGTNGIFAPPNGYLQGIRKLCDKYGILMICDEVMCGFGRTGEWFAVNHWNVVPDIITMAKGLTSAYLPLGAVAVNKKIAQEFEEKYFSGGLTYQAHPMCMAASLATIKVMEDDKVVENSKKMGKIFGEILENLKAKHISVGDVRYIGLFGAIELVKNRKTKEPLSPYGTNSNEMMQVMNNLRDNGVFAFNMSNVLHTHPPLVVKENELREVFTIVDKALDIADSHYQK